MKKSIFSILVLLVLAFNVSACAGTTQAENPQPAPVDDSSNQPAEQAPAPEQPAEDAPQPADDITLDTSYENAVSEEIQIILGSINLKDTDLAITADQAKTLLPLLNEVKSVTEGMMPARDEAAPQQGQEAPQQPSEEEMAKIHEQFKDLYTQIKAVFTIEQLQAIADMKITRETAMTTMETLGITMGGPQDGEGARTGDGQAPQGEPPSGGEPPAGDPGEGGQPPADGQAPAEGGQRGGGMMVSTKLIEAIITYLETLASS